MAQANSTDSTSRSIAMGIYVTYLVGAFTGVFWLIGLAAAFVLRDKARSDPFAAKHLEHQVRMGVKLLIVGAVALVVNLVLVATVIGVVIAWIPLLVWWVWALVASVKGLLALVGAREPR